ncbi:tetratricopeptide repeat protein [Telmatospirillum sp.]|uniref:tetratricopeptide repeat protein n=1 Tax=Telmatospirillum sp. TaxID=2079197 RepID=UPI002847F50C|nr:tetratricopeptide repeat protein [Telmatospirillum sp.]MDR3435975.1 tetratricopeptide repeat protein [Telmatospirillum sp.]
MRGSAVRLSFGWRQRLAVFLMAALPACVNDLQSEGPSSAPADNAVFGRAMTPGTSGAGNYLAGRFAQNQSDLGVASDYLARALQYDPENTELLQRTYLSLAANGRLEEAGAVAKRLLTYDGEAAIAALLVAEQQAKAGNWGAVEDTVTHLPNRGLNTFMIPLMSSWAKAGQGRIDAALEALAPLAQNSNFATLHDFHAALINDLADRPKDAERYYRSTLAGSGGSTLRTTEAAIGFYRRIGQNDKAIELINRYRQEHPEGTMLNDKASGARTIDSARAGMAEALFDTAGSLRQGRASELALIFARMAVDLQPDFPLAQVMVADLLQGLGRLREANAVFEQISSSSSVYWSAQLRIAANDDDLDEVDAAIRTLERLADQHADRPEALVTLGDVLRRHKRWSEAVAAYDRALANLGPARREHWGIYYSRGIALERSKQWTRAESDFLRALELEPDEPHVLNYLGYSWIEQGVNIEAGRQMIEKAVAQLPKDGYIIDSLGWAFYRSGDFGKAVEVLEQAVELHPEDASINDHLGDALWKVGREDEARFQWQRALTFDPEPELKQQIESKLTVVPQGTAASPDKNATVP